LALADRHDGQAAQIQIVGIVHRDFLGQTVAQCVFDGLFADLVHVGLLCAIKRFAAEKHLAESVSAGVSIVLVWRESHDVFPLIYMVGAAWCSTFTLTS